MQLPENDLLLDLSISSGVPIIEYSVQPHFQAVGSYVTTGQSCWDSDLSLSSHSISATRDGNTVLFHHQGGVDVGDVDAKAVKAEVDIESTLSVEQACHLVKEVPEEKKEVLVQFLQLLYKAYSNLYFTLLEINPLGMFR